ncbi:MAG: EAL domain-containing protein [Cyanobacteria bacterium J06627_28]
MALDSKGLLCRVGSLLLCPMNASELWPQVLAAFAQALSCSTAQLLGSMPTLATSMQHYGVGTPPTDEEKSILWRALELPAPLAVNDLWCSQMTKLQARLAKAVSTGTLCLQKSTVFAAGSWPSWAEQVFGEGANRHLLLLPLIQAQQASQSVAMSVVTSEDKEDKTTVNVDVDGDLNSDFNSDFNSTELNGTGSAEESIDEHCRGQDCVGVLVLIRSDQPWLVVQGQDATSAPTEIAVIEAAASQIYLAMQRAQIERLQRSRSAHDQLTQLPDRLLFTQQLTQAIAQTIESDKMLGVAFLDLDRFKNINDTLGHEVGDGLLKQVADRLQNCLRGYDVVARWGGDEFTLLLYELRSAEDISHIAERILQRLSAPFRVQGEELYVTASLGIALAPYDGDDAQTLLRNADAAMYQAKARGRNNYQVYFDEINAHARTQLNLETDLRKAIEHDELFLCYQPQVDLQSGRWIGMEALIRWNHPTLGMISPGKFIPIAEETGLIEPIGHWVLHAACAQYQQWHQAGMPPMRLAVNLSAQQFQRTSLVRSVIETLKATQFDPHYLELEVTESAAMHDVSFAIQILKKLGNAGIQIAMDDFGTGYSSLSVLKYFPLDTIKIDRSFVQDLVDSPSDAAIASTIIALAKGLDFKVLAEGIETPEQQDVLSDMGCDYAQGYWFSRPLTVQKIDELLAEGCFSEASGLCQCSDV